MFSKNIPPTLLPPQIDLLFRFWRVAPIIMSSLNSHKPLKACLKVFAHYLYFATQFLANYSRWYNLKVQNQDHWTSMYWKHFITLDSLKKKNWYVVALQCYISSCSTVKWISSMYTYIPSLLGFPPTRHSPSDLGHHRAPNWAPCVIQRLPASCLFYT